MVSLKPQPGEKMSARVSDYKNSLYHREYGNDLPQQETLIRRVALAVVPFLSLHPSLRTPISGVMGSFRILNSPDKWSTACAVISLASTVFNSRVGQVLTTVQDIVIEVRKLDMTSKEKATKSLLKIFNNLVYLALISRGGIELSLISFAMQTVMELIQSIDEFKGKRWIEGVSHLLMAMVRLHQTHGQCRQLQRNWEIEAAIQKFYVGKLGEKWRFPSDHLPVGIEVNGVRIISWNVLNNSYMEWVTEKDSQGLNGSLISELNQPIGSTGLTMRDVLVADMVKTMMSRGDVIALQECGAPFLECLQQRLLPGWKMVKSFDATVEDEDVILYNESRLKYTSSETNMSVYPSSPGRHVLNALFSHQGQNFRILNAHIPGDPNKPGREEFGRYVFGQHREGAITVGLGDNNFERHEMIDAYRKAGFSEFSLHSPWQTNIDPYTKESKGIDHFFIAGDHSSRDLQADEVLQNLGETIGLLRA